MNFQPSISQNLKVSQSKKRKDIQALRALAIISVVLFHICPKTFTNGYLGVDVFFVISGHLMAQVLGKYETLTTQVIQEFYVRRIKRIVPIFLVVMYGTLHCAWFVLLVSPHELNRLCWEAMTALTFTSNINEIFLHRDYFEQLSVYRFFLHTWSLAVEVQFYLLVPILFQLFLKPEIKQKLNYLIILLTVASISLQWSCNTPVAFNLLFCRLWQFLAGVFAHFVTQEDKRIELKLQAKLLHFFLVLFLSATLFSSISNEGINGELLRLLVVILTALLLYLGSTAESTFFVFRNSFVTMLGDISYAWYLVHWPILVFTTYWSSVGAFNWKNQLFAFVSSIITALLADKIDSYTRNKIPSNKVFQFIAVLYSFCFVLVIPPSVI